MTDAKQQAIARCIQILREIEGPGTQVTVILRRGPVPEYTPVVKRLQDVIGSNGIFTTEPEPLAIGAVAEIVLAYKRAIVGSAVMAQRGRN